MNTKAFEIIKKILGVLAFLGLVLMIGTVVRVSAYTVFVSDDFWHAHTTGALGAGFFEQIKAAWDYNYYMYMNHQGAYSLFFLALFNPVSGSGFLGLRIIMIFNAILFFGSMILLIEGIYRAAATEIDKSILLLMLFAGVFVMTQYDAFVETFYWYTGATNYSMPLALVNLVIAMSLNGKRNASYTITASILAFLAAGGVLPIGGSLCYVLLLVILYELLTDHKLDRALLIVTVVSFLGTLLNFLSPGYRIRQGIESSTTASLSSAIADTLEVAGTNMEWLFVSKNFVLVLLVLLDCGFLIAEKTRVKKNVYFLVSVLALLLPFITIFPVVYGYNNPWMPNRCVFITIFVIDMVMGNLAVSIGALIGEMVMNRTVAKKVLAVVFAACFVMFAVTTQYQPWEYTVAKINKQLYDRQYQDYYADIRSMFEDFKNHQGEDVEIDVPTDPDGMRNFYCFFLVESDNRINEAVAWANGLNSISNVNAEY